MLSALEWTPVVAVGANCEFSAELSDWDSISKRLSAIANPEDVEDFELQQQTWHFSVAKQGTVFNIQISQTRNAFELSLNAHTEIKGHGDTQRDRNSFAMNACDQFFENRTETITLAESILGVEVER